MRKDNFEKFREKFLKLVKIYKTEECINWTGKCNELGYGIFYSGYDILAHRFSYRIYHGDIDCKMYICHTCGNSSCVNPKHLYLGTPKQNSMDKIKHGKFGKKLNEKDVHNIRNFYKLLNVKMKDISVIFGISESTVYSVLTGKSWKHI